MADLTKEELQEKIKKVKLDLSNQQTTGNPKILLGLSQYIEFLEEELKSLDNK